MSDNPLLSLLDVASDFIPGVAGIKSIAKRTLAVTDALGLTEDEAVDLYKNDPVAFEAKVKENIAKLDANVRKYEADIRNTQSARDLAQDTGFTKLHYYSALKSDAYILAGLLMICFFHDQNVVENIAYTLIGAGITSNERVQNFLFGSSAGSKAKSKIMNLIGKGNK